MDDEDRANGIPITALREISILRGLNHPNIINTLDIAVGEQWEDVYLIMEYVEQVGDSGEEKEPSTLAAWDRTWPN